MIRVNGKSINERNIAWTERRMIKVWNDPLGFIERPALDVHFVGGTGLQLTGSDIAAFETQYDATEDADATAWAQWRDERECQRLPA